MFLGEHRHALDDKGRVTIPARLREDLGDRFVVTKGLDHALFLYDLSQWDRLVAGINLLPFTQADARAFARLFLAGATEVEVDRQGRILLAPALRAHARLERDTVILGVGHRVEIWATETWEAYQSQAETTFESLAEKFEGLGGLG